MENTTFPNKKEQVSPDQERSRFTTWPKIGICLDEVMGFMGRFEKIHKVKIEIFTFFSPFENYTKHFIPTIKKPEEIND
jgi:hypothetical protein